MTPTDADYRDFADDLRRAKRVLVTTHVRPDADALGTTAAMTHALNRLGIKSTCAILSEIPDKLAFLHDDVPQAPDAAAAAADLTENDALLICDTGTWSQLPGLKEVVEASPARTLVLDHHLTQEQWPDRHLVDTSAGAAAEVAATLLDRMGVELDERLASPLYAALVADTGGFRFSSTTPRTLRVAADCVAAGADPAALDARMGQCERPVRLRLFARGLSSLEWLDGDGLAVMQLTLDDQRGAGPGDGDGLVNEPLQVAACRASLLLKEDEGGHVKLSLRTKPGGVDAAAAMSQLGGGGHARAAGGRTAGTLTDVRARAIQAVRAAPTA